jgi:hypothetical protein
MTPTTAPLGFSAYFKRIHGLTLVALAISGFAQMPIFKRYYIALVMAYIVAAIWAAVGKKRWTTQP